MNKIYSTLIIDDERLARARLKKLLVNFSDTFSIIGEAKNGREAATMIIDLKPAIIFLDIEMPGLTGFELLEKLEKQENIPFVIFCTAFDHYSLKAFETNSIDYLVKPIRLERLQKTVNKLTSLSEYHSSQPLLKAIQEFTSIKEEKKMTSITVKKGNKIVFIKLADIYYLESADKYVTLYTSKGKELTEQTLSELEITLPANFLRVQRSIIININFVIEVQKYFNSRYHIVLDDKNRSSIKTGRSYKDVIKNWMNI